MVKKKKAFKRERTRVKRKGNSSRASREREIGREEKKGGERCTNRKKRKECKLKKGIRQQRN